MTILQKLLFAFLPLTIQINAQAQIINHWETAIYNSHTWHYHTGSEPSPTWMLPSFDASVWPEAQGGLGYGDDDDNTIINATTAVYLRKEFYLVDTSAIKYAILHADYDDAFVAYLNGVEIARNNIGTVGIPPSYVTLANTYKEALLYNGELPEAYPLDLVKLRSLLKDGYNTLAVQVHNHTATSSDLSSNFFLSLGISNKSKNYNETPSWFQPPFLGSTLPLVLITTQNNETIQDEPKINAHMGIIDHGLNQLTDPYNGYDGAIGIEIRGASSQSFPKKNYGFETRLADGTNNNVSILGMPAENDWILHGPYTDKSLLRNVLAYHMGRSTGRYAPRTQLCELYINNEYSGVYMMTERIKRDKNRVDIANLKPEDISGDELTGGYIIQIDRDNESSSIDGWYNGTSPNKFYAYHDPSAAELDAVQREYIKTYITGFESGISSSAYTSVYSQYVDVPSWVDYFLVTEVGKHIDAYKLSFYMHKAKNTDGGKLHFGPLWDFNLAFGNFDYACSPDPEGWTYQFQGTCDNSHPFWVKKMTDIPAVSNLINCRWQELRRGALHTDSLLRFIDDTVDEMGDAPTRNFEKWQILGKYIWPNDYVGDTYQEEIAFLKNWLTTRLSWMDNNILGTCDVSAIVNEPLKSSPIGLFPNPANSDLFVDLSELPYNNSSLKIYNQLGQEVLDFAINAAVVKINVEGLEAGIYGVRVFDSSGAMHFTKFIKQ